MGITSRLGFGQAGGGKFAVACQAGFFFILLLVMLVSEVSISNSHSFLCCRQSIPEGEFYLAGGSGYTLSRKTLKAYVEGPLQSCETTQDGSDEDFMFSNCLRKHITTQFIYTGDVDGSQRFHQGPVYHPVRYRLFRTSLERIDKLPRNITGLPEGVNQIQDVVGSASNSSITFHRHYEPDELRRLELLLYKNVTQECLPYVNEANV